MFKSKKSKVLLELVAIIAVWSCITLIAYAAGTYEADFSSVHVSSVDGIGTYATSGNGFTVSVAPSESSGSCGTTNYSSQKSTVTLTNNNSYRSEVSYTIAVNGTNKGSVAPAVGTYVKQMDPGDSFAITFTSGEAKNANANYKVTINYNKLIPVNVSVASADEAMGKASATASGSITPGTEVTFTATAEAGNQFDYWKTAAGDQIKDNPYKVTVTKETALTAYFKPLVSDVDISVSILSDSYGTVTMDGSMVFSGLGGKQTVPVNTEHTLVAAANEGYVFAGWLDGNYSDLGSALMSGTPIGPATKSVSVGYNDLAYTAIFVRRNSYSVSVDDSVKGTATVQRNEETPSETSVAAVLSQTITYTATAKSGYVFEGWYAGVRRVSTDPVYSFTVLDEGDLQLQARFREPQLSLALGPGLSSIDVNIGGAAQTIAGAETFSVPSGTSVTVTGQVASGYTFYQWQRGTSSVSTSASYTFTLTGDTQLTGFTKNSSGTVAGVCKNVSTGNIYATVKEGVAAATSGQTVVLIADATVTQSFTIPSGVTLLIPYGSETSADYSKKTTNNISIGNVKYTLTVPQGVTVNVQGTLCVNAMQGTASTQRTGNIAGDYGKMLLDGELTVSGTLRAYGIISGSGSITAQSSASVYQYLEMTDYRGGGTASAIYKSMFPINQFYIQNIQVTTTYQYGSKLYGHWYVYVPTMSLGEFTGTEMIVGPSTESRVFFKVSSGDIVWHYNASRAKSIVELYGSAAVSSLKISVSAVIITIDMDSAKVECPLSGAFDVTVKSGANVDMANQFKILPGGKITVEDGGTLNVSSNLYLYDVADYKAATWNFGGYRVKPLTAGGGSITETEDGQLEVNGTLNVTGSGKIYSSSGAGNASSSVITTENTGKIVFQGAAAGSATIKECENNAESASAVGNFDGARGKFAETGTWDKFAGSTTYYSNGEAWYLYKITYYNNGTIVGYDYTAGGNVTRNLSTFSGADASVISGTATANVSGGTLTLSGIGSNVSVDVTGTINTYIPTFVLNETQYANYRTFTGGTLSDTVTINGSTYHVVLTRQAAAYNSPTTAPTNVAMGVTTSNANSIAWYLSDSKDGTEFAGTVPEGETAGGPVYIYGIYTGAVVYNSFTGQLYTTLEEAFVALPGVGNATISMINNCGAFVEEDATLPYLVNTKGRVTFDLNGFHAVGRIINNSNLTIDLNGGTLDYHSGATAANQAYRTMAAVTNNGTLTIKDSAGGGKITTDIASENGPINSGSVIRNLGQLTVTGGTLEMTQMWNGNNAVIFNYNGGTIASLSNASLSSGYGYDVFNYGARIDTISNCTMEGSYGVNNRNLRGSNTAAQGFNISAYGTIGTIEGSTFTVGQYAVYNGGRIDTLSGCTFTAHPDSAQADTLGNGSTARHGNTQCYTVMNSANWWYDANYYKRVDDTDALTRTDTYLEDEQYRPTINKIVDCTILAENTSTSANYGYALYNAGIIGEISGTTEIKTYKYPNSTAPITTSNYALLNAGGIIKRIAGSVNVSASNYALQNSGQFATQIDYTYGNKVGGNITQQVSTFGNPSKIESISGGTFTADASYALINYGYIPSITGGTFRANNNIIANAGDTASKSYTLIRRYSDNATASTKYYEQETYIRNNDYGSRIDSISGVTITTTNTNGYYAIANNGYIGTLSGFTISSDSTRDALDQALILNGDVRQSKYVVTSESTQSASGGYVMPRRWHYEYTPAVIDTIENMSFIKTSKGYAFDNRGQINTLQNSTIQATQYALYNDYRGSNTTLDQLRYYSGATVFTTTRNNGSTLETNRTRTAANIGTISNCTITTTSGAYALYNAGNIGTLTGNTITAKTSDAIYNGNVGGNQTLSYTCNVEEIATYDDNGTAFTFVFDTTEGAKKEVYVYGVPTIGTIGEGNTITATTDKAIENLGQIQTISGEGLTITANKGIGILNQTGIRENRTINRTVTAAGANSAVASDVWSTVDPATIGTIGSAVITATSYGIQNGTNNSTYSPVTITTMGEGTEVKSTDADAVYHYGTYAQIGTITGGIYTAFATNKYAINNVGTKFAITISGGDFKGGTNNDASLGRNYAIYDPDNPARQTYPTDMKLTSAGVTRSVTFADGTPATGYYYLGPATVVAQFVGGAAGEFATLQAAVAAYPNTGMDGSTYIQMTDNSTEAGFTIGKNVYLDLNGKTVTLKDGTGATGTLTINKDCTLYGLDHTTDEYTDTAYGKIIGTVGGEGTVAVTYQTPTAADGTFQRYVKFADTEKNELSFHRYNISVSGYRFEFNANDESALYFQGTFSGSDIVKKLLRNVGFQVDDSTIWWKDQHQDLSAVTTPKYEIEIALTGAFTPEELKHEYTVYALLDFGGTDPAMSDPKTLSFWTALQQRYKELTAKDEASRTDKEKAELAVLEQLFNGTSNTEQNTVT